MREETWIMFFEPDSDYDRIEVNEDGTTFYGYDDGEGHTTYYDEDGNCDCSLPTPSDD